MDVKYYFKRAFMLHKHIVCNQAAVRKMQTLQSVCPDVSNDAIAIENLLNNETRDVFKTIEIINRAIMSLNSSNERLILKLRYLEAMSWADVAAYTGYSIRHVQRLHRSAMEKLEGLEIERLRNNGPLEQI